ncbi:hypothetical protein ScalyP_jg5952 [Parmales sp. scaly parma]|nr:hypothetical protein ScalyP_jg5952 [Parmales sp. scaly parma]
MKFLLSLLSSSAVFAVTKGAKPKFHQLSNYSFEQYAADFDKYYIGKEEMDMRRNLFDKSMESVTKHNLGDSTYKQGINKFSDMTTDEIGMFKGSKRERGPASNNAVDYKKHQALMTVMGEDYPASIDWREKGVTTPVKNQGGCGSCWAFSGIEVLETHVAIQTGTLLTLSPQEFVSCAPNPDSCGGTGGCEGSVQWLAFDYATQQGLSTENSYPYDGKDTECDSSKIVPVANITGYVRLPTNDYDSLMGAMQLGSVAISVSAAWTSYESGVYTDVDACGFDIDHAVVAEGYGTDENGVDFWLVRNSWGTSWGEDGYIKLLRNGEETSGMDNTPADGSACLPYPEVLEVKGICGILSDSSYPTGGYLL